MPERLAFIRSFAETCRTGREYRISVRPQGQALDTGETPGYSEKGRCILTGEDVCDPQWRLMPPEFREALDHACSAMEGRFMGELRIPEGDRVYLYVFWSCGKGLHVK